MTAKQVLNAKPGQKVGLGNGLRLVCDARNGARYFELRKRVRGKDYSWGVGNVETLTIAGCNMALSAARPHGRKQAFKVYTLKCLWLCYCWVNAGIVAPHSAALCRGMNDIGVLSPYSKRW